MTNPPRKEREMRANQNTFNDAVQTAMAYRDQTGKDYGVFKSKRGNLRVVPLDDNPRSCICLFRAVIDETEKEMCGGCGEECCKDELVRINGQYLCDQCLRDEEVPYDD